MVKLLINSRAVIDRLIGGDSAVELELRQAIVVDFMQRHLKPIAESEAVADAVAEFTAAARNGVEAAAKEAALTFVKDPHRLYGKRAVLTEEMKQAVYDQLHKEFDAFFKEWFEKSARDIRLRLERSLTRGELDKAIDEALDRKLDERFGTLVKKKE